MRIIIVIAGATLFGAALLAHVASDSVVDNDRAARQKDCVGRLVTVENSKLRRPRYSDLSTLRLHIHNGLPWPISGVRVVFAVDTVGRPVPYDAREIFLDIPGGVNAGETRRTRATPVDLPRSVWLSDLRVRAVVTDVMDVNYRQLVGEAAYRGAAGGLSPLSCRG